VAKDTEKLIRQLSLISYLMAEGRPVSALDIQRDVEGYSDMKDDAFARRFYADRAELESLGITLKAEKPAEGFFEAELYTLPPENYYLDPIKFTDDELAALQTALALLDGKFAYSEPFRLALQQVSWGRPNPLTEEKRRTVGLGISAAPGGRELSQRLSKVVTAISRRKTIEFTYYTMERDDESKRKVDPYHLVYRDDQFYLIGWAHERDAVRVFRLSRIRGKVSYATKAEHDFTRREDYDGRDYARRAPWQLGDMTGTAKIFLKERIAWLVERDFGLYGEVRPTVKEDLPASRKRSAGSSMGRGSVFITDYSLSRELVSWVMSWRGNAAVLEPAELAAEVEERRELIANRHDGDFEVAKAKRTSPATARTNGSRDSQETPIRPERFARLVTLAGRLIEAARKGERLQVAALCDELQLDEEELREDIDVLNVINFGGGTYVLYAEIQGDEIEVDSEPYGDSFARPARLLPLEANALVAAIDLLGDHLPEAGLQSARRKVVKALGHDPAEEGLQIAPASDDSDVARAINKAIADHRLIEIRYYKENEDQFTTRRVEPYRLENGREGWYVESWDPDREAVRHFRLDRIKDIEVTGEHFVPRPEVDLAEEPEEWLRHGEVTAANVARVWVSPERARWVREERPVVQELTDGAAIVEYSYAGPAWLIREVLKGASDLVVLEPEDAREAILKEVS
jgi:proteasome accessory factor C